MSPQSHRHLPSLALYCWIWEVDARLAEYQIPEQVGYSAKSLNTSQHCLCGASTYASSLLFPTLFLLSTDILYSLQAYIKSRHNPSLHVIPHRFSTSFFILEAQTVNYVVYMKKALTPSLFLLPHIKQHPHGDMMLKALKNINPNEAERVLRV